MKRRIVFRPQRCCRALAVGSIVAVWSAVVFPLVGMAATVVTYKDKFTSISFAGSDGTAAWAGPWTETGESDGPSNGAVQVENDSHCTSGNCLQMGAEDPDHAAAARCFDSNGATSVVLTFNYLRHLSSSGPGSGGAGVVRLLASADGTSWNLIDTFPLNVDDSSPIAVNYDLTTFAGMTSAIKFELEGGVDDSHMSIDNVAITVTDGGGPPPTSTTSVPSTSTTTAAPPPPTTTTTTTAASTTTTSSPSTTTVPVTSTVPSTTTTLPARTTTTATATTHSPTATTAPARATGSATTAPTVEMTTTAPTTTTTEATVLQQPPSEPPSSFTPAQARAAKENLVAEIPSVDSHRLENGGQIEPEYRLDPREGLAVSFTSAVETLKENFLNSILLGVTISIVLLLGIDQREGRSKFPAPA